MTGRTSNLHDHDLKWCGKEGDPLDLDLQRGNRRSPLSDQLSNRVDMASPRFSDVRRKSASWCDPGETPRERSGRDGGIRTHGPLTPDEEGSRCDRQRAEHRFPRPRSAANGGDIHGRSRHTPRTHRPRTQSRRSRRRATRVYDRYPYDREKRIALETWGRTFKAILERSDAHGTVVPFAPRGGRIAPRGTTPRRCFGSP